MNLTRLQLKKKSTRPINPHRCIKFVVVVRTPSRSCKVMAIYFSQKDGSIFVDTPYFHNTRGILASVELPPGETSMKLSEGEISKVSSNLVKFSYHPEGRAHFSMTRRVNPLVHRKVEPLRKVRGHMFTLYVDGLQNFEKTKPKDEIQKDKRMVIDFEFAHEPNAIRFVGRRFNRRSLDRDRLSDPVNGDLGLPFGPVIRLQDKKGQISRGMLLAPPEHVSPESLLVLECIPCDTHLGPDGLMIFLGGFDPGRIAFDHSKPLRCLAGMYPCDDFDELSRKLGTIDILAPEF